MEIPDKLRPYVFHGLRFVRGSNHEWIGNCPFCDKEGKFYVNDITGLSKCWSCAVGKKAGLNAYSFLRELHSISFEATNSTDYQALAIEIRVLDVQSLIEWQIAKSVISGDWLIPGYNISGTMTTLYRYARRDSGGYAAIPTATIGHQLLGMNLWNKDKPFVYVCEGWKDGIVLFEILTRAKNTEQGLAQTSSRDSSLYASANVISIAGATTFYESWLPLFEGKVVNLLYDSDHPKKHPKTGHITPGAGWHGMERAARLMSTSQYKPQEINCIYWGDDGYDPSKKSGYDIRDFLTET